MSAEMFSLSLRDPVFFSGKETDCLCTHVTKCTRCTFLYILMSEKVTEGEREKAVHNTEATAVPQFSVVFDAWPHSHVSHMVSLHLFKINLLHNFEKRKHNLMHSLNI